MQHRVGGTRNRHENAQRIFDGFLGNDFGRLDRVAQHAHRCLAGLLGGDKSFRCNGRDCCCAGKRHAQHLCNYGHRRGRSHHGAGSRS